MTLLHRYSDFAADYLKRGPSSEVVRHAKRALIDWLASLYSAVDSDAAQALVVSCRDELGAGRSSVLGFGTTAVPATAAWLNGTVSHVSEMDDSFRPAIMHPGCPVVAAALALAEADGRSGLDLLNAIVVGYEVSTRIGAAVQPAHVEHFHAVGTIGTFGASAAAAALLSPEDPARIRNAIAISTTFAAGLQQAVRSSGNTKPLHAGNAAAVGLRAAQAAAAGFAAPDDMLEGMLGFGVVMADRPDWSGAAEGLGEVFNITRTTHKVHACCGHQFLPIDMALLLREKHGLRPEQIEKVEIVTYRQALDATARFDPATAYEAKFSMPYVVSHALIHGSVGLSAFRDDRLAEPALRALMPRFTLSEDPAMTAAFPNTRLARIKITLKDGSVYEHEANFRRGDPEWPLSDAELNDKFRDLSTPLLGAERVEELLDLVWRLDELDVRDLRLMTKP